MSDCPRKDIRNLNKVLADLGETAQAGDIEKVLNKNIENALKGTDFEHTITDLSKISPELGKKYENWVNNTVSTDGVAKGASKAAKIFGKELDEEKVKKLMNSGAATKLLDSMQYSFNTFRQNLTINCYDNLNKLENFSAEEVDKIWWALNGTTKIADLPEHLRGAAQSLHNISNRNADELIRLELMREEDKIEFYTKHYFAKHLDDSKEELKKWLHGIGLDENYRRKNLTPEQLKELQIATDKYAIVNSLRQQFIQIEKGNFLKFLADNFAVSKEIDGWVRFGVEKVNGKEIIRNDKWGQLAGKYVSPDMYDALISSEIIGAAARTVINDPVIKILAKSWDKWTKFIAHLKVNLTVKNPATHLANYLSNLVTATQNGDTIAAVKMTYALTNKKSKAHANAKMWQKVAYKHGLSMITDELMLKNGDKVIKEIEGFKTVKGWLKNLYLTEDSKAGKWARELYNAEDGVFKLAHFKKIIENHEIDGEKFDIKKYLSGDWEYQKKWKYALDDAMKISNEAFIDYGTRWNRVAQMLDRGGVMPFLQYSYKSIPQTLKNFLKNPHRYAALQVALAFGGLHAFQSREKKDAGHEEWARNGNFLGTGGYFPNFYFADTWVKVFGEYELNLGRIVPGLRLGDMNSLYQGGFLKTFINLANGKSSLGYDIVKKDDNALMAIGRVVDEAWKNFMPSTIGRYGGGAFKMGLNELADYLEFADKYRIPVAKDSRGKQITFGELVARLFGTRSEVTSKKAYQQSYNKALKEAKKLESDGDKVGAKELRDKAKRIKNYAKSDNKKLKEPR